MSRVCDAANNEIVEISGFCMGCPAGTRPSDPTITGLMTACVADDGAMEDGEAMEDGPGD